MRTVTVGASPVALPAVPVSVGVAVSTVAATVGPVIATAGPSDVSPLGQAPPGMLKVMLSMKTALSTTASPWSKSESCSR